MTEPDAGLDTTKLSTRAERQGDEYVVHGRKIWISTAQVAHKMLLLARTTPLAEVSKPTQGLSLFYTDLDRERVEVREIEKMGRKAVDSNMLFIDGLRIPAADRIGEEGRGFEYILHGLNPERILIAAEAVGIGRAALDRAVQYAGERTVFGRPIGQNQGIQHPLAQAWMQLEAANLMVFKAASLYDAGLPCGPYANSAKYLGAEAGHNACQTAVLTLGGMLAPVLSGMVLAYLMQGLVSTLERLRLPGGLAVGLVFALFMGLLLQMKPSTRAVSPG